MNQDRKNADNQKDKNNDLLQIVKRMENQINTLKTIIADLCKSINIEEKTKKDI